MMRIVMCIWCICRERNDMSESERERERLDNSAALIYKTLIVCLLLQMNLFSSNRQLGDELVQTQHRRSFGRVCCEL